MHLQRKTKTPTRGKTEDHSTFHGGTFHVTDFALFVLSLFSFSLPLIQVHLKHTEDVPDCLQTFDAFTAAERNVTSEAVEPQISNSVI